MSIICYLKIILKMIVMSNDFYKDFCMLYVTPKKNINIIYYYNKILNI